MTTLIKHFNGLDHAATDAYWRREMAGATRSTLFAPVPGDYIPMQNVRIDKRAEIGWNSASTTNSVVINGAFSIALSHFELKHDVVFRTTGTGRNIGMPYAHYVAGPLIDTFPVRVRLDPSESFHDFLADLQQSFNERQPYEYRGLENIRKCSPDAAEACSMDSAYLIVQPDLEEKEPMKGMTKIAGEWQPSRTPLSVCAIHKEYGLRLFVSFDDRLIKKEIVGELIDIMVNTVKSMVENLKSDGRKSMQELLI